MMHRLSSILAPLLLAVLGCTGDSSNEPEADNVLVLATTTSPQDSGLLDVLLPAFEEETGIEVRAVAVGSGQALEIGRRGDADVLLTHSPKAEEQFMSDGFGIDRRPVMHNDFVLLGPADDPAGIQGETSVVVAFREIAEAGATFISRGDESGTHVRELEIWRQALAGEGSDEAEKPDGEWYLEAGSGMAQTLRIAFEKQAYTLSDRPTYLNHRDDIDLVIHSEGDPLLLNNYSVIIVSRDKHPHARQDAAEQFADFLTTGSGRDIIASFGVEEYGRALFVAEE